MTPNVLSPREFEIARFAANGLTSREIGERLVISSRTVETHIAKVYEKLEIGSRVQLAMHFASHTRASESADRSRVSAPADVPEERPRHNLPRTLTSFIERDTEIAEIGAWMDRYRLVTIVGAGGVGKTRIALEIASRALDRFDDGVWFVEFAPIGTASYLESTVAKALDIDDASGLEGLVRVLQRKRAMLVFDNCEHLVADVAAIAQHIMNSCPDVRILATSRQRLDIGGEGSYLLATLGVPRHVQDVDLLPADVSRYPAMALFVERATAVDRRFELTTRNVAVVAEICRRLDGLPLAIELAAARVNILSPRQLRDRLDERFRVLAGGGRDLSPRQQTLRALLDWSHDLLDERERTLFRRLGIFINGFTIEGAVAVGGDDELGDADVFDVLASLVEKSLVLAEPDGDALRYRLLESTRAYASERLVDAGERESLATKHVRYFRDRFTEIKDELERTDRSARWYQAFATEVDDLRFALDGALARHDLVVGAELLAALEHTWIEGCRSEGIARLGAFLAALPADETTSLAKLSTTLSWLMHDIGATARSLEVATQACAYARSSGDRATLARALSRFASACVSSRRFDEAEVALTEAFEIPHPSARTLSTLMETRAYLSRMIGDLDGSTRAHERLVEIQRALGNTRNVAIQTLNLAEIEHARGNTSGAIALAREVLPTLRSQADRGSIAGVLGNLASYLMAIGRDWEARTYAREAIVILAPSEPEHWIVIGAIELLALIAGLQGDVSRCVLLCAYADATIAKLGTTREYTEQTTHDRLVAFLDANSSRTDRVRAATKGVTMLPEAAVALALEVGKSTFEPPDIDGPTA